MRRLIQAFVLLSVALLVGCSTSKMATVETETTKIPSPASYLRLDTVKAGRFDTGKMWTFDYPPIEYFKEAYNFSPSKEWFEKARLSALRLPNCSASFVSEDGLVMTNHHCARSALDKVNREGENLPENGFYAKTLEEERKVPGLYVDQLVLIKDVTDEVQKAFESGKTDEEKIRNRDRKIKELEEKYSKETGLICKVITFYNGGKYSLYGYKRYTDVRLVFAPEQITAFFGGDPDNFTYPRYDLDVAFFRVYENGKPLKTKNYFKFSQEGAKEGDVVFVIGNPGRTRRLYTVSQLEFLRDYAYPYVVDLLKNMVDVYSKYLRKHPEDKLKYETRLFGLANALKAYRGRLGGLRDPYLMAKKMDFERKFKSKVMGREDLKKKYANLWSEISSIQKEKSKIYGEVLAYNFNGLGRSFYFSLASKLIKYAKQLQLPNEERMPDYRDEKLDSLKKVFYPKNVNLELENATLVYQLKLMKWAFGDKNNSFNKLTSGLEPEEAAKKLVKTTVLSDSSKVAELLNNPEKILNSNDPFIKFVLETSDRAKEVLNRYHELRTKEQAKVQLLGRALYDIYGTSIPPDATFTLRIADGVVKGYEYNGTIAPPITTFYGLYDRFYSFKKYPWDLPERWKHLPPDFDLSTPLNFVSTNDIIGGNSGSPVINKNLEVVGVIFDGNIESLPSEFIYEPSNYRAVSVHTKGILEALEKVYKADRIVKELKAGKIVE